MRSTCASGIQTPPRSSIRSFTVSSLTTHRKQQSCGASLKAHGLAGEATRTRRRTRPPGRSSPTPLHWQAEFKKPKRGSRLRRSSLQSKASLGRGRARRLAGTCTRTRSCIVSNSNNNNEKSDREKLKFIGENLFSFSLFQSRYDAGGGAVTSGFFSSFGVADAWAAKCFAK